MCRVSLLPVVPCEYLKKPPESHPNAQDTWVAYNQTTTAL